MNVQNYSKKVDGGKYITPNIKVNEVACKDGSDTIKMDYVMVCHAQYVRDLLNKPLCINSAYRTKSYNAKVGGASSSRHLVSCAMDMYVSGIGQQQLANYFYSMGLIRVGVYNSFVHADTDRSPRWLSQGKFSKVNIPCIRTLKKGTKDYLNTILQYKLNCLGYNCGTEDGDFGIKTFNAVKSFQSKNKLLVDGVVGKNTWNKLFN